MTTHIMAMTYQRKIPGVRVGTINHTIRAVGKVPKVVGDKLLIHGWSGVPYHSKWNWRLNTEITELWDIDVSVCGIIHKRFASSPCPSKYHLIRWNSSEMDAIAKTDGMVPTMGIELFQVLNKMHKLTVEPQPFQRIFWARKVISP